MTTERTDELSLEDQIRMLMDPITTCLTEWADYGLFRPGPNCETVVLVVDIQRERGRCDNVHRIPISIGCGQDAAQLELAAIAALEEYKQDHVDGATEVTHFYCCEDAGWHVYATARGLEPKHNKAMGQFVQPFIKLKFSEGFNGIVPSTFRSATG